MPTSPELVAVGVDGSDAARAALRAAARIARQMNWQLRIVHVAGERHGAAADLLMSHDFSTAALAAAEVSLEEIVEGELPDRDDMDIEVVVREGAAASVLVEQSADAQLLVIGGRHKSGMAKLNVGSVSDACVHRAACPVLVYRDRPDPGGNA